MTLNWNRVKKINIEKESAAAGDWRKIHFLDSGWSLLSKFGYNVDTEVIYNVLKSTPCLDIRNKLKKMYPTVVTPIWGDKGLVDGYILPTLFCTCWFCEEMVIKGVSFMTISDYGEEGQMQICLNCLEELTKESTNDNKS